MEQLLIGIVLAILSGLAFIAYNDPPLFHKFKLGLYVVVGTLFVISTIYQVTLWRTSVKVSDAANAYEEIQSFNMHTLFENLHLPAWFWISLMATFLYLILMEAIADHRQSAKNEDEKDDKDVE